MKKIFCVVLVLVCALAAIGCGEESDSSYKNYIEHMQRYVTEKELVVLMVSYDKVYSQYKLYDLDKEIDTSIEFVINDETIITHENIIEATMAENSLTLQFDNIGAKKLQDATASNIGGTLSIVARKNAVVDFMLHSSINSSVSNTAMITSSNETELQSLFATAFAYSVRNQFSLAAKNYNLKKENYERSTDYLPSAIPTPPQKMNCAPYIEKAISYGFIVS